MCGSGGLFGLLGGGGSSSPQLPPVVQRDPRAEQAQADAASTDAENAARAMRRKSRQANSLLSTGAAGIMDTGGASSVLAMGSKSKLGQ